MAPIRLRHPKGSVTIEVDFDHFTVLDLQQEIFAATEIPPSRQELKAGYPPRTLMLIPELPLDSLGIKGEQLTVIAKALGSGSRDAPPSSDAFNSGAAARQASSQVPLSGLNALPRVGSAPASSGGPEHVQFGQEFLVHQVAPDDNSCLFSSVALIFAQDKNQAALMRKIVADEIRKDPVTWNEAILGRPRDDYISTILKPTSWGGAIELTILAKHFSTEIASVDVETGRVDNFPPPAEVDSGNRCILIYSGIHYDAATVAPMLEADAAFHQTVVPADNDAVLNAAKALADKLRAKKAYTNTATFDLRCQVCQKGLKGEKEARAHATETGHVEFGEY